MDSFCTMFIQNANNHGAKSALRRFRDSFHVNQHWILFHVLSTSNRHVNMIVATLEEDDFNRKIIVMEKFVFSISRRKAKDMLRNDVVITFSICSCTDGKADPSFCTGLKSSCESAPSPAILIPARCCCNHGPAITSTIQIIIHRLRFQHWQSYTSYIRVQQNYETL